MGPILAIVLAILINALVIWIVGMLNMGLTVRGYVGAIVAAIAIAIVSWVIFWLLGLIGITLGGGFLWAIVTLIIAAVILLISDRFVPGMEVQGFGGAIVAAIAMAVVSWLLWWLLGLLGLV